MRYKRRKNIGAEKGESLSEPEGRGPYAIIQIVEIPHLRGEEEELQSSPIIKESLSPNYTMDPVSNTHDPMCVTTIIEITVEDLSKTTYS
jgi:hypothetical protein